MHFELGGDNMIILAIVIGCILGAIIGLNVPTISYIYSGYLAIAIIEFLYYIAQINHIPLAFAAIPLMRDTIYKRHQLLFIGFVTQFQLFFNGI